MINRNRTVRKEIIMQLKKFGFVFIFLSLTSFSWAKNLAPVTDNDWGLKIVIFDVGQADAALFLTPDGESALVDIGRCPAHGQKIADYLIHREENKTGNIDRLNYLFASHYDSDHIGGASGLDGTIKILTAYDQGPSAKRHVDDPIYAHYLHYIGDSDGNGEKDPDEPGFVRHKAMPGQTFSLGHDGKVRIMVLSAAGDTSGTTYDLPLDPSKKEIDENPGSLIMLVTLNEFEYFTTGDATSDDWKNEPDTEEAVIKAHAIPGGDDIDVLKVSHHGSDTSNGKVFISHTKPEVAIINANSPETAHKLPKLTSIKVLEDNRALVLVTGSAKDKNGQYNQSKNNFDDGYIPRHLLDNRGTITILVNKVGLKYTVRCEKDPAFIRTYSARDCDNRVRGARRTVRNRSRSSR